MGRADFKRTPLPLPAGHAKVLLHSCCAPCSGEIMAAMAASGINFTVFFYNPNVHPRQEHERRKRENIRLSPRAGGNTLGPLCFTRL
jgi:predicted adenine nucleotide alpha hydrolase (AANH) superfamily ATPase